MSRNREFRSLIKGKKMLAVAEAKSILCTVPREHRDTRASWLRKAGGFFGLTYSQAKKLYYEEISRFDADRLDAMRATIMELKERADQRRGIINEIAARLDQMDDQPETLRSRSTKVG